MVKTADALTSVTADDGDDKHRLQTLVMIRIDIKPDEQIYSYLI